jgi:hypothetical protein
MTPASFSIITGYPFLPLIGPELKRRVSEKNLSMGIVRKGDKEQGVHGCISAVSSGFSSRYSADHRE